MTGNSDVKPEISTPDCRRSGQYPRASLQRVARYHPSGQGRSTLASHDRDLDVVDRGQRIEQAVPLLTTLPPDPQLTGRRAEIECRCLELIDVHRVAQDGEVALLPRQPTC